MDAACEYLYRLRTLVEWTPFKGGEEHKDPRQFLYDCLPIIAEYQETRAKLVEECRISKRALKKKEAVQEWLRSGEDPEAFFRAQLLIVLVSAIMHRIGSPSPGRDFLFRRVFLPGGNCIWCHGGPSSHTAAASARRTLQQYRPAGSNQFSVRVARLEPFC